MSPGTLEKPPVAGGTFSKDEEINALIDDTEPALAFGEAMKLAEEAHATDEDGDYERVWWFMKGYKKKLDQPDFEFPGELEILERLAKTRPEYAEELKQHQRRRGIKGKK